MKYAIAVTVLATLVGTAWWGLGPVPMPRAQANWAARGPQPQDVAWAFLGISPSSSEAALTMSGTDTEARVIVTLSPRGDDSVASIRYNLMVIRTDQVWRVKSATRKLTCKRGFSFRGSPCP